MEGMPIGIDDFRKLRDGDLCYVDKSMFIDGILESSAKVTQIVRPRRFGKTLNLSMTDAYLNVDYKDEPDRFRGLKISEARPDDPEKNSNHIIMMNFTKLRTEDYSGFLTSFGKMMGDIYRRFPELKDSDKLDEVLTERYGTILDGTDDYEVLTMAVMHLCEMIERHHGKKPIILIDGCDDPINSASDRDGLLEQIVEFLRDTLGNALKDNDHMRFAIITGVMEFPSGNIFSGLNDLGVNNFPSTKYGELFGFSLSEVERLLDEIGHPEKISEFRDECDRYRFGDSDMYSPEDVISSIGLDFVPGERIEVECT